MSERVANRARAVGPKMFTLLLALLSAAASARGEDSIRYVEPDAETGSSKAVVVGPAPLAHTTQLFPLDAQGKLVGKGRPAEQAARVLDNIALALKEAKSGPERIVKLNVYAARLDVLGEVRKALAERFRGGAKPAVSFVVGALPQPDALVAMDAVAVASPDPGGAVKLLRSDALAKAAAGSHVAILPAGPRVYVAGQAEKGASLADATRRTLASLRATLNHLGLDDSRVVQLKAFVTPMTGADAVRKEMAAFFGERPVPPVVLVEWESSLPIEIELIAAGKGEPGEKAEAVEYLTPPGMKASPVFSRVARVNHGTTIYTAGLYGTKSGSGEEQIEEIFAELRRLMKATGSDFRHLAKATYYVSDDEASRKLNELRPKYYDPRRPPAASKAMVPGVGMGGKSITLDMIAVPVPGQERPPGPGQGAAPQPADELLRKARSVLAQIEGEIAVPGLKEPVEVLRDRWGVPHIYAKNADDLFFAQGFVAAQDRLFQIDLWRRTAVGETAEVVGRSGLAGDRFARLLKYRGDMDAEWASYSTDARAIVTAFVRGVNAYIDHVGDRLPVEYQILGLRAKKWRPEDCLGRMSGIVMTRNFQNEVSRAQLVAAVGAEKARRLAPADPPTEYAPAPGLDLAGIDRSVLAGYSAATRALRLRPGDGSNNWVVAGELSASGKPLLASDPHRAIALPSLRYLVHLHAPGWNVIGSGEPALPGVAIGHNEHVAWGFTIVGTDQADLYVEETHPDDPTRYKVGDRWEKMTVVREKVNVRGEAKPAELELRFTRHGPVIHEDRKRRRAYALRWAGAEPGGAAYLGSLALDRARNAREFVEALKAWKCPSENMVFADTDGNIGWVAAALTPVRKGWDGLLPVPGASGDYEWQGFRPLGELPQALNPASRFLATANHNILPPGYPDPIAHEWSTPYRYERVRRHLTAGKKFDLNDFRAMQHDDTTLPGLALARLLKDVELRDPGLRPYAELMTGWDGSLSADSRAGPLYGFWLRELLEGFYRPHVPPGLLDFVTGRGNSIPVMLAALEKPDPAWFGENPGQARDELIRRTFADAVAKTKEALGPDTSRWAWGRLHTASFRHPLSGLGREYAEAFDLGPVPRPGDGHTPNAGSHGRDFRQTSGASYRHVLDLADWDRGLATSTPGQSGQPGSPHYGDLLPLWEKGEYFPLAFSRAKVEEVTRHRLLLKPAE